MEQPLQITHDAQRHRFETVVDGVEAYVEYLLGGGLMTITHTWVPEQIGGRGVAGQLVRTALDHARGEGLKVRPRCPYADAWMQRHPEYEELRA